MAYIGKSPVIGNFVKLDAISVVNGQAAYTMQNGGSNFTDYESVNQFLVSLNGTIQAPTDSFTVSGSTLTFASNLSTGDVIDFIMVFGNSLSAGTPTDATVTTAKLADDAVTNAKLSFNANQFRNIIINGDMSIAQRDTSVSSVTGTDATCDRWRFAASSAGTWTISQSTTVPTGQGFATSFKADCTTANGSLSAGSILRFSQFVEGQNLQYLKKGTSSAESLTISFWVRSAKTGTYILNIKDRDNSRIFSQSYTISSADTWEKKTITFAGDTTGAFDNDNDWSLEVHFYLVAGSNYTSGTLATAWESNTAANLAVGQVNLADSTSNDWYVTGIQVEAGTSASDFEHIPVDVNLERCRRYCQALVNTGQTYEPIGIGYAYSTSTFHVNSFLNPIMRAAPTISFTSGTYYYVQQGGGDVGSNSLSLNQSSPQSFLISVSGGTYSSAGTSGICFANNTSASVLFLSEFF
jgi:hypothetical protein